MALRDAILAPCGQLSHTKLTMMVTPTGRMMPMGGQPILMRPVGMPPQPPGRPQPMPPPPTPGPQPVMQPTPAPVPMPVQPVLMPTPSPGPIPTQPVIMPTPVVAPTPPSMQPVFMLPPGMTQPAPPTPPLQPVIMPPGLPPLSPILSPTLQQSVLQSLMFANQLYGTDIATSILAINSLLANNGPVLLSGGGINSGGVGGDLTSLINSIFGQSITPIAGSGPGPVTF